MANIASSVVKINDVEVAADAPITEALLSKIGATINGLIDNGTSLNRLQYVAAMSASGSTDALLDVYTCPAGEIVLAMCYVVSTWGGAGQAPNVKIMASAGGAEVFRVFNTIATPQVGSHAVPIYMTAGQVLRIEGQYVGHTTSVNVLGIRIKNYTGV